MPITFRIKDDDEIILPAAVLDSKLSISEIGTLVFLVALNEGFVNFGHVRILDPEMSAAMKRLKERGIVKVTVNLGKVTIEIDLDKAMPPEAEG